MLEIILGVTGLNFVVLVGGVFRFARWTGIVDTRLTNLERRMPRDGNETGPTAIGL